MTCTQALLQGDPAWLGPQASWSLRKRSSWPPQLQVITGSWSQPRAVWKHRLHNCPSGFRRLFLVSVLQGPMEAGGSGMTLTDMAQEAGQASTFTSCPCRDPARPDCMWGTYSHYTEKHLPCC